jgi:hypothetical protein
MHKRPKAQAWTPLREARRVIAVNTGANEETQQPACPPRSVLLHQATTLRDGLPRSLDSGLGFTVQRDGARERVCSSPPALRGFLGQAASPADLHGATKRSNILTMFAIRGNP